MTDLIDIQAGFMPLLDAAILIVAHEKGFAKEQGIRLHLVRETSWANIRDKLVVGHFEVAHMLAPMPIAAALGLTPFTEKLIAPVALGLGGNAVTVSEVLWRKMCDAGASEDLDATRNGQALAVCAQQALARGKRLRFGVVHPHSAHNLELRYWLRASGIDPDRDVEIGITPPPLLPAALNAGQFDGFSVGEPWNSIAVSQGARIATVKSLIWRSSPEKVLGMRSDWADANPDVTLAIIRALYNAAQWCGSEQNRDELKALLSSQAYLDCEPDRLTAGIFGQLDIGGGTKVEIEDFFLPFAKAATFPWVSHALWFYTQLLLSEGMEHSESLALEVKATYRPDLYRSALMPMGVPIPSANAKVEGALSSPLLVGASQGAIEIGPDGFFDKQTFDPDNLTPYIARLRGTLLTK